MKHCIAYGCAIYYFVIMAGLKTNRYGAFLGDPNTMPEQKCYCPSPDNCLKKGVMDLYKCIGAPLVASHPHFYMADEAYLTMVDGLKPSRVIFFILT